jgi:hypothetical protein
MSLEDKNNTSGTGERARGVVGNSQGNETRSPQALVVGKFTTFEKQQHLDLIKKYIRNLYGDKYSSSYLTRFFILENIKNPREKARTYSKNDSIDIFIDKRIKSLLL